MAKVSMVVPDAALALIDSVAENRSSFMVEAAVRAAQLKLRQVEDDEIADWCSRHAATDASIEAEFARTLKDGLE